MTAGAKIADPPEVVSSKRNQFASSRMRRRHGGYHGKAEARAHELKDAGELVGLEYRTKFGFGASAAQQDVVAQTVALLQKEEALPAKITQVDFTLTGIGMILAYGEKQRFARQLAADDVRISNGKGGDGKIKVAGLQLFEQVRGGVFCELQVDFRKALREFRNPGSDEVGHDGGNHAYAKCASNAVLEMCKRGFGFCDPLQNVGCRFAQGFTECGQAHRAAETFEERITQLLFEPPNLLRQRWLRNAQLFGCARKAASAYNRSEVPELVDFHQFTLRQKMRPEHP
jgi:hypothetical protein